MFDSISACLKVFTKSHGREDVVELLIKDFGITRNTAFLWLEGKSEPVGMQRLKLLFYLHDLGYQMKRYSIPEVEAIAKLIVSGECSMDEVRERGHFPRRNDVVTVLTGVRGVGNDRLHMFREILKEKGIVVNGNTTAQKTEHREYRERQNHDRVTHHRPSSLRANDKYEESSYKKSLNSFVASFSGNHKAALQIVHDLGIKRTTARDWIHGKRPRLENYIILGWYLTKKGYTIPEFEALPTELKELGAGLIARRFHIEDVVSTLGDAVDERMMWSVHCGLEKFDANALAKLQSFVHNGIIANTPEEHEYRPPPIDHDDEEDTQSVEIMTKSLQIVEVLTTILKSAGPLIKFVASDKCSKEYRRYLRDEIGDTELFELVTDLYKLVGERTRRSIMHEQQ